MSFFSPEPGSVGATCLDIVKAALFTIGAVSLGATVGGVVGDAVFGPRLEAAIPVTAPTEPPVVPNVLDRAPPLLAETPRADHVDEPRPEPPHETLAGLQPLAETPPQAEASVVPEPAAPPIAVQPTFDVAFRASLGLPGFRPAVTPRAPATPAPAPAPAPLPKLDAAPPVASPPPPGGRRPMVAIMIDDMGYSAEVTERIAHMPAPLSLSFLPYGSGLAEQTASARGRGHEIWAHVPMEPFGRDDPGPRALKVSLDQGEILDRFAWSIARVGPVVGFNNHMGSRFTTVGTKLGPVLDMAAASGLYFVDSVTAESSVAFRMALERGINTTKRDVFLDHPSGDPAGNVRRRLAELEEVARRTGTGLAIGHPGAVTLQVLEPWLQSLEARGFDLVAASRIVDERRAERGLRTAAKR